MTFSEHRVPSTTFNEIAFHCYIFMYWLHFLFFKIVNEHNILFSFTLLDNAGRQYRDLMSTSVYLLHDILLPSCKIFTFSHKELPKTFPSVFRMNNN